MNFRTGDRVRVNSIQQMGVVKGRKNGQILVHFGTQNNAEAWAWYPPSDLTLLIPEPEVVE